MRVGIEDLDHPLFLAQVGLERGGTHLLVVAIHESQHLAVFFWRKLGDGDDVTGESHITHPGAHKQ